MEEDEDDGSGWYIGATEVLICGILGQVRSLGWSQVAPGPFFELLLKSLSMLFTTLLL